MSQRSTMTAITSGLALAFGLASCAGSRNMTPAPSAETISKNTAVGSDNNVQVIAKADAWSGDARISEEVTPMRVTIENNSNEPLRVQYGDFKILGSEGQQYSALPPLNVTGAAPLAQLPEGWVAQDPDFIYNDFNVAPYYSSVYTGVGPYVGYFPYDAQYYGTYYSGWPQQQLPTVEMILRALPEGVVQPGGRVEGFLYFEKVSDDAERAVFSATLDSANGQEAQEQQVASIEIPFTYK